MDPRPNPDKIISDHIALVRALIKRVENKSRDEIALGNLDRLKQRINIAYRAMPSAIITQMSPFMLDYREDILNRNEQFFMSCDAKAEYIKKIGKQPPPEDEFVFALTDTVRAFYKNSPKAEQDSIYTDIVQLFMLSVQYMACTTKSK